MGTQCYRPLMAVALATGLIVTIALVRSRPTSTLELAAPSQQNSSAAPTAEPSSAPIPIDPHRGLKIVWTADANGWVVAPDAFGVWVAGAGTLTRIDPETGETRVTAHGPWDYDFVRLAEYGEGTIYVTSKSEVLALDAGSGTVVTTMTPSLGTVDAVLADGACTLWVAASGGNGSQVLAELDANSGAVLQRVHHIGEGLHALARAGGYIFVSSNGGAGPTLLRIDTRTAAAARVRGTPPGTSIAGVGSHLWIAEDPGIRCIDASTLEECGAIRIPGFVRLAASGRRLWALSDPTSDTPATSGANPAAAVTVIDGVDGKVLAGPSRLPRRPSSIAALGGRAWVGYYLSGHVAEIAICRRTGC